MAAYLGCLAVLYGVTAHQAHWGGPLWWPAAVAAATLAALAALGFAAGTLLPSRFTAPLAAIAAFFVVALSTQLISAASRTGTSRRWSPNPGTSGRSRGGPFYPYVPDLAIAQVMFLAGLTVAVLGLLAAGRPAPAGGGCCAGAAAAVAAAGLLAAGTAAGLAGTGTLGAHGMIAIPALHDAATDRPLQFTPVCSGTAIPVCLNPAYASYLPADGGRPAAGAQPAGRACRARRPGSARPPPPTTRAPATGSRSGWPGRGSPARPGLPAAAARPADRARADRSSRRPCCGSATAAPSWPA